MNVKATKIIIAIFGIIALVGGFILLNTNETKIESDIHNTEIEVVDVSEEDRDAVEKGAAETVSSESIDVGFKAKQRQFEESDPEFPDEEKIIYTKNADGTFEPELHPADAQLWSMIEALSPTKEVFERLKVFEVYYDEEDSTLAAVESLDDTNSTWLYSINYTAVDEFEELAPTIVHEYAHILSLQDSQTTTEAEQVDVRDVCENYLVTEGCLKADAYLDDFFEKYWEGKGTYIGERDRTEDEAEEFFEKNSDDFVSAYATTNPAEDFAESFMFYVLKDARSDDVLKEQKKSFFQTFDTLQAYRTSLHTTISAWAN